MGDEDLAGWRLVLQPAGDVHGISDGGLACGALGAEQASDLGALAGDASVLALGVAADADAVDGDALVEGAQAGLSWSTILKKRPGYRAAFANFDIEKVAAETPDEAGAIDPSWVVRFEEGRRAERIATLLESGPQTAFQIATTLFPGQRGMNSFLAVSEVIGHLDLLVAEGRVRSRRSRVGIVFEAVPTHP